jgi:uncharacterized OB-fold protein
MTQDRTMTDPALATAFEEALDAGTLLLRRCTACGLMLPPDRALCPSCWSKALEWHEAKGTGIVYSAVEFHRAFGALPIPYTVVQVELDEGPRVIGWAEGKLAGGTRVRARLADYQDSKRLQFEPLNSQRG